MKPAGAGYQAHTDLHPSAKLLSFSSPPLPLPKTSLLLGDGGWKAAAMRAFEPIMTSLSLIVPLQHMNCKCALNLI